MGVGPLVAAQPDRMVVRAEVLRIDIHQIIHSLLWSAGRLVGDLDGVAAVELRGKAEPLAAGVWRSGSSATQPQRAWTISIPIGTLPTEYGDPGDTTLYTETPGHPPAHPPPLNQTSEGTFTANWVAKFH